MTELQEMLKPLYKSDQVKVLLRDLEQLISRHQKKGVGQQQLGPYAAHHLYVTYPDAFCLSRGRPGFATLSKQLPRLRALGFDALHVLPFLQSPMIDKGFDVQNYLRVRSDLGGNRACNSFLAASRKHGLRVFMDIVMNHVSEQSAWFKAAEQGQVRFRRYFITSEKEPKFIRKYQDASGEIALYEQAGKEIAVRIVFPEQVGRIPHWRLGRDGYWYYHTFYPHQLEMNWHNPEVFLEYAKILSYWAARGLSFRLDAIQLLGKKDYMNEAESSDRTHQIVKALREVVRRVNSESIFLVEVFTKLPEMLRYFGSSKSGGSELSYNFQLCASLWSALEFRDGKPVWQCLRASWKKPAQGQWVTFLRNHDELCIRLKDLRQQRALVRSLMGKGLPFRSGCDVSGRTASLLGADPRRLVLAYALLASLPGVPALIYGDELGKENDLSYMKQQTRLKRRSGTAIEVRDDTRDINRGEIRAAELKNLQSRVISREIAKLFSARASKPALASTLPQEIKGRGLSRGVMAGRYRFQDSSLVFLLNLTGTVKRVPSRIWSPKGKAEWVVRLALNGAEFQDDRAKLPAYGVLWVEQAACRMQSRRSRK